MRRLPFPRQTLCFGDLVAGHSVGNDIGHFPERGVAWWRWSPVLSYEPSDWFSWAKSIVPPDPSVGQLTVEAMFFCSEVD